MTDELKPCPMCGNTGKKWTEEYGYESGDGYEQFYIECTACHVSTGYVESEAEAIAAWNRRTGESNAN